MRPVGKHRIRHLEGLQDGVWVTSALALKYLNPPTQAQA